jgi:hypothetical protein
MIELVVISNNHMLSVFVVDRQVEKRLLLVELSVINAYLQQDLSDLFRSTRNAMGYRTFIGLVLQGKFVMIIKSI